MSLLVCFWGVESARAQSCTGSTGAVPNLRYESKSEQLGAVVLSCAGVASGASANFAISLQSPSAAINGSALNIPVTSRPNEAVLSINGTPYAGAIVVGVGLHGQSVTTVQFNGVVIPASAFTVEITGVRGDMTTAQVYAAGFGEITELISVSNATLPIANNNFLVGVVLPGLGGFSISGQGFTSLACGGTSPGSVFNIGVNENFPTAFKIQGTVGGVGDSETGGSAIQATTGTEFAVSFSNVPNGVNYCLPLNITSTGGGSATLVLLPGAPIVPATQTGGGAPNTMLISNNATVYYNVTAANPSVQETFNIPVIAGGIATSLGSPIATVGVTLAPIFTLGTTWVPTFIPDNLPSQGASCQVSGVPGLVFDATSQSERLPVAAAPACLWSAFSNASWITISGANNGTGNGGLNLQIQANTTGSDRSGQVTINGQAITIAQASQVSQFTDVQPSSYYFDAVNLLYSKHITAGCNSTPLEYCPSQLVTRTEMAIFLVRMILGGDPAPGSYPSTPYFNDVTSTDFGFSWIQKLAQLGITAGCGGGNFCPNFNVTRDQMAVLLIRARYGATTVFDFPSVPYFTDVPNTYFAFEWIQRLRYDGLTSGCGTNPPMYCPDSAVDRGDMAILVMRAGFNELLAPGTPVISSIAPNKLTHGATTTFTINGVNTHFGVGTMLSALPGVTVNSLMVNSPTQLTVQLTAAADIALEPLSPLVITGTPPAAEEAVLPNGLGVQ